MYVYDDFDRTLVAERVAEFRDQVSRRLSGALTEDEFKPLRLMNGVYLQLHAYMLRIAIPYGTLSSAQMRMLAHVARRYDRDFGHFTTRQNIQFHWIKLAELPDAMADLANVGLHGMQTSGNCVRNLTTDQWAGVAPDEIEDPARLGRDHSPARDDASRILIPAAQIQDRRDGGGARSRCAARARSRPAAASQRCRRSWLRGDGRRWTWPHAIPRQDHQAIPADARSAELRRSRHEHVQSVRPARQSLESAHQDSGPRSWRRGLCQGSRGRMAGDQGWRAGARSCRRRRDRRALPLSGL